MASRIENYGLISNMRGSALVSRTGSIDWLCLPRFDSDACMAALLGRDEHGCWTIDPAADIRQATRRYRPGTTILETEFACSGGRVRIVDFMPLERHSIVRIVEAWTARFRSTSTSSRGSATVTTSHGCGRSTETSS